MKIKKRSKKMRCDLHTHTVHSDGSFTPKELISAAKEADVIIALTDHNTVSGLPEFLKEAERQGVSAVGGVELSTEQDGKEFHLIGLFVAPEFYSSVEQLCLDFHERRRQSNINLIERLCDAGYQLDFSEVSKMNVNGRVNRAHIAKRLVEKGYVNSIPEAFEKLLDEARGFYTPPVRISLAVGIKFLREIKAVPILAHPLKEISAERLREILPVLKEAGLVAIETMHSSYSDEHIALSKEIAKEFCLLESGGSDFHGAIRPGVKLGVGRGNLNIDSEIFDALLEAKNEIN